MKATRFNKDGQTVWTSVSEKDGRTWYSGAIECVTTVRDRATGIINKSKTLVWLKTTESEAFLEEILAEDIKDVNAGRLTAIRQFSLTPFYVGQEEDINPSTEEKLGRYSRTMIVASEDALSMDRKFIVLNEEAIAQPEVDAQA